ncbi:putative immunity protein [Streptomyces bauhiniae]|uniref:putative immunity protein n=1 Tax=Streptomyces bauhiniae TaxID=2340725 RepID=UPI00365109A6
MSAAVVLSKGDLRAVTAFAAACAETVLGIFEADQPEDPRPRDAIGAAWAFARGGERGKVLRDTAWAALKAARSAHRRRTGGRAGGDGRGRSRLSASAGPSHPGQARPRRRGARGEGGRAGRR